MPGTAILNPEVLIDAMVTLADEIREDLHRPFGVRQWEVYSVVRTWTGAEVGAGRYSDQELRLVPQPLVKPWRSLEYRLEPCGLDEAGAVEIEEVSLSYAEDELTGGVLRPNQQQFFRVADAHGQRTTERYFVNALPPYPDRVKTLGWLLKLTRSKASVVVEETMPIVTPSEALFDDLGALAVNGSVTPQDFAYIVPAGKRAVIQAVNFVVRCSSDPIPDGFGNLAALANGVSIQFLDTDLSSLRDPLDGSTIRRNEDWALLGGAQTILDVTGDMVLVEWFLPSPISLAAAQRLRVRVADDLTAIQDLRVKVSGFEDNA